MKAKGKVYFVGAGPGNPELLTLAAVRLIRDADVILYDELIPLFCLNLNQKNLSEKIYVGKKSGNHFLTQDHINQIIIDKYRQLSETSQQDFF